MGGSSSGWSAGAAEHAESSVKRDPRWPVVRRWIEWIGTATIFMSIGIGLAGLADRAPPFRVIDAVVPAGAPGETIVMEAHVWRNTARRCSATMYRSIFHSGGKRVDLAPQFFGPEDIVTMDLKSPGLMRPEIEIPENAEPGRDAYMSSRLRYVCNQFQVLLPIDVNIVQPFTVLASR